MSEQTKQAEQQQPSIPSFEDAYGHLMDNVHARVFFNKLASHGIVPQSEPEARELLEIGGKLRSQPSEKQASSRFSSAASALNEALGTDPRQRAAEEEWAVKSAAEELMEDPSIYNSVLSLRLHEAMAASGQQDN